MWHVETMLASLKNKEFRGHYEAGQEKTLINLSA